MIVVTHGEYVVINESLRARSTYTLTSFLPDHSLSLTEESTFDKRSRHNSIVTRHQYNVKIFIRLYVYVVLFIFVNGEMWRYQIRASIDRYTIEYLIFHIVFENLEWAVILIFSQLLFLRKKKISNWVYEFNLIVLKKCPNKVNRSTMHLHHVHLIYTSYMQSPWKEKEKNTQTWNCVNITLIFSTMYDIFLLIDH